MPKDTIFNRLYYYGLDLKIIEWQGSNEESRLCKLAFISINNHLEWYYSDIIYNNTKIILK